MIVSKPDVERVATSPRKADPPLVVYADRPLPGSVALQLLEPIAGRYPKRIQLGSGVQLLQTSLGEPPQVTRYLPDRLALEEPRRASIREGPDHAVTIRANARYVNRTGGWANVA